MAGKKGPPKDEPAGAPAWVMTFADLMSLLMCFFVLLLSFSEMDAAKYKQVAGSMKHAFGVQRDVKVKESPKGVSIIAKEFSPGKPQPTIEKVLRQQTTDENRQYLEILKAGGLEALFKAKAENDRRKYEEQQAAKTAKRAGEARKGESHGNMADGGADSGNDTGSSSEAGKGSGPGEGGEAGKEQMADKHMLPAKAGEDADAQDKAKAIAAQAARVQAAMLNIALEDEVDEGLLEIETVDDGVLIRVREQGSFPSGTSDMAKQFLPVLDKIAGAMVSSQSKLIVSGHTDNRPISTRRYPSNWALSAARATSVVQAFAQRGYVDEERMEVRALADTDPVRSNDDAEGRANNRRVEIFIGTPPEPVDSTAESLPAKSVPRADQNAKVRTTQDDLT
jgi:chemotaxis protein MotB